MKYVVPILLATMLLVPTVNANDCDKSEVIVVGDKQVVVSDPLTLLRQARNGGVKKTSGILVEHFGCHPVLEIIAKDNGMGCGEFLEYTGVIREFDAAFATLEQQITDRSEVERLYNVLLNKVVEDIVDQILAPRQGV